MNQSYVIETPITCVHTRLFAETRPEEDAPESPRPPSGTPPSPAAIPELVELLVLDTPLLLDALSALDALDAVPALDAPPVLDAPVVIDATDDPPEPFPPPVALAFPLLVAAPPFDAPVEPPAFDPREPGLLEEPLALPGEDESPQAMIPARTQAHASVATVVTRRDQRFRRGVNTSQS